MPVSKDQAEEKAAKSTPRHIGAQFLGGRWIAADGTPLNDKESQLAHRAADAAAAKARAKALLGGAE